MAADGIAWSPNGKYLLAAFESHKTYIWDMTADAKKDPFTIDQTGRTPIFSWSPDSQYVVSIRGDDNERQMLIWNIKGARRQAVFQDGGNKDKIGAVLWSPDGKLIVTSDYDGTIRFWDATKYTYLRTSGVKLGYLRWDPSSKYLVGAECGTEGNKVCSIRILDVANDSLSSAFQPQLGWIYSLEWSPNGKFIASDDGAKSVYIWDASIGRVVDVLRGYVDHVTTISWNSDGTMLAAGSLHG